MKNVNYNETMKASYWIYVALQGSYSLAIAPAIAPAIALSSMRGIVGHPAHPQEKLFRGW